MMRRSLPLLLLAACSPEPAPAGSDALPVVPVGSAGGRTTPLEAEAAAAPELAQMDAADLRQKNMLGAGCLFHDAGARTALLAVRYEGDALARTGNRFVRLAAATPDAAAISAGTTLAGDGMAITVERGGGTGTPVSRASRDWPATLLLRTAAGAQRSYAGRWECA